MLLCFDLSLTDQWWIILFYISSILEFSAISIYSIQFFALYIHISVCIRFITFLSQSEGFVEITKNAVVPL